MIVDVTNSIRVLDTGDYIENAIIKNCCKCLKRTPHKIDCRGWDSHQKGRFNSEGWNFFHLCTLGLTYLFIVAPYKREPTQIYYYEDKCMECGLLTKVEKRHQSFERRSSNSEDYIIHSSALP